MIKTNSFRLLLSPPDPVFVTSLRDPSDAFESLYLFLNLQEHLRNVLP